MKWKNSTAILLAIILMVNSVQAQVQTTGKPGSPNATTTLDGRYLPNPPAKFDGKINLDAPTSTPSGTQRLFRQKELPMCY